MTIDFNLRPVLVSLCIVLSTCLGCGKSMTAVNHAESGSTYPWFQDYTDRANLHFVHSVGPLGKYAFPEIMGSGAALFDYDGDGRLDLYLVQNAGPDSGLTNRLYHQEPDGTFRDVSDGSGLDIAGWGMGVAIGDVNNDGLPDLVLTEYGGVRLFLNQGHGKFIEATSEAGLSQPSQAGGYLPWATSASFIDYDRDGWLDLVVTFYVAYDPSRTCTGRDGKPDYCGPNDFPGSITRVYHNLGASISRQANTSGHRSVKFEDVTDRCGLGQSPGKGLGVLCADFNGDGWPDIFVTNDAQANRLWINQHDGTFVDQAMTMGVAFNETGQPQGNMGIAWQDIDGDGLTDLFVTHLTEETNTLWIQIAAKSFADRTVASGLVGHGQGTGFGTVLADFDNSGWPSLAIANGRVVRGKPVSQKDAPDLPNYWLAYAERNQLFANQGGKFTDISAQNPAFCGQPNVGRGLAWGSLNNDGAIDLVVTTAGAPARLLKNVAKNRGHWLLVRAIEPLLGGRDAYGARIVIFAGGRQRVGWVTPGSSYLCSNDPRVHFGLGSATIVDGIDVLWPEGQMKHFDGTDADRIVVLKKGAGTAMP